MSTAPQIKSSTGQPALYYLRCLLFGVFISLPSLGQANMQCHLHPPRTNTNDTPAIIGPFANQAECERENAERFHNQGRCHCQLDSGIPMLREPDASRGSGRQPLW